MVFSGSVAYAQEHPESEHPQQQPGKLSTVAVTKESLAEAIRRHVAEQTKKNEGVFLHEDEETGDTLRLTFKKVHEERLSALGDHTYFACADFATAEGEVYDLDIFMKEKSPGELVATEVVVHKKDGVERYTWSEVEGFWKKVPVEKPEEEGKEKE